jgi:hypothetical protein
MKSSTIAICLISLIGISPVTGFAQGTTTFSGQAAALRASAVGIALDLSNTGALPQAAAICRRPLRT